MPKKRSMLVSIKEYLNTYYSEKITLDDLSDKFYINKYYLAKSFKERYGVSVNNYLLNVRITKAKELFGWEARYGIDEMCEDGWRFIEQNPNGL